MQFEVDRHEIRTTRAVAETRPEAGPGEVVLEVERFAFTANNVTYAVVGDTIGYWYFFPTEAPWVRVPVMGYARVVESQHGEISPGGRVFGFFPMGRYLTVQARPSLDGFTDVAERRAPFAAVYRSYQWVNDDDDADVADRVLLLRGLFLTSFLVDDFLADNDFFGADQVVVLSASSKTAIALARQLSLREAVTSVGVTSAGNMAMVEELALYDTVVTYEQIGDLDSSRATVSVDMSGSDDVLSRVHRHFGPSLTFSSRVGVTHWEERGDAQELEPRPEFFFAPGQIKKRTEEWGADGFAERTADALAAFVEDSRRWMHLDRSRGSAEIERVYLATVDGRIPPDRGQILIPDA